MPFVSSFFKRKESYVRIIMWHLHRITHWNEVMTCDASGEIMFNGDFYYEDDETGKIISAKYYRSLKDEYRRDHWDQSALTRAQNEYDYKQEMKQAEQDYITNTVLYQPIWGRDSMNNEGHPEVNGK